MKPSIVNRKTNGKYSSRGLGNLKKMGEHKSEDRRMGERMNACMQVCVYENEMHGILDTSVFFF